MQRRQKISSIDDKRHSLAHLLAVAVLRKFPGAKLGIGPTIENGFYYDFDFSKVKVLNPKSEIRNPKQIQNPKLQNSKQEFKLIPEILPEIEKRMRELIKQNLKFKKEIISFAEAKKLFKNQPYKLELIKELHKGKSKIKNQKSKLQIKIQKLSIYKSGDFVDLCKGPHIKSASEINIDSFKLTKIAGAYWRGDEKNPMLTRIYGIAFETKKELDDYLKLLEEAEKRDHRRLGKTLDLFVFSDLVGPGLPLFTSKGVIIIDELKKYVETVCRNYGFEKVSAPCLSRINIFEISGHIKKFGEELFHVSSQCGHKLVMKPVQCPHHTQIYASKPRSYRDLPIRYMESDKMYRAEKPGEVGGLSRVYAITVEDGHIFCRLDQVKDEIKNIVNIIKDFYSGLDMWGKHRVSLSVRDKKQPEKYIGDSKDWNKCEKLLKEISDEMGLGAKRREGEAAIYGPKLDFMFKDAMGKEIQIPTVQLDFATPKKFNLVYINEKGKEANPVMIHRAILGSYERFLLLLLEHFSGALPLWLSPVQTIIIPVSDKFSDYGNKILQELKNNNIRAEINDNNETLGKRIRNAELQKIPYILVVGDKEIQNQTVNVRHRGQEGEIKIDELIEKIKKEIEDKQI